MIMFGALLVFLCGVAFGYLLGDQKTSAHPNQTTNAEWLELGCKWVEDGELQVVMITPGGNMIYRGSCTVWHQYPTGRRASTKMEMRLSQIWQREVWARDRVKENDNVKTR